MPRNNVTGYYFSSVDKLYLNISLFTNEWLKRSLFAFGH